MNRPYTRILLALSVFAFCGNVDIYAQGNFCTTALSITPGTYTADGPGTGAGASGVCYTTGASNADWYVYTPSANGTMDVYSCFGGQDTRLSVYSGSCTALVCAGNNDDSCPMFTGGSNFASQVLNVPVTGGQNYYIEWDDRWTTAGFDWVLEFNCANAPQSTYQVVLDCANNQFFVDVTITSMGSATSVNITNNGGAPDIIGVGLGVHTVGPFALNTPVQYTLVNVNDPGCDFFSATIEHFPCPFISCGPDNYTTCYYDSMDSIMVYQSNSGFPLALVFNAGTIDTFGDDVIIYDGADDNAPILFQGNNGGDLTGVLAISTNPNNYLTMRFITNTFSSCATSGGLYDDFDWTVACLDCTNPGATYGLVPDCVHRQYFIEVDVDSTGNAPSINIVNSLNSDTIFNVGTGITLVGPFGMDTVASVTLLNSLNPLCRQFGPDQVYLVDSCTIVSCGIDYYDYCYENNDNAWYTFQADTALGSPITIQFQAGEMATGDKVVIYNGRDDLSAVLFNGNLGGNLAGLGITSSNPEHLLTMRVLSDASASCDDGQVDVPFDWFVSCGAVGITELKGGDITLYPNPASDHVTIQWGSEFSGDAMVNIYDATGRVVSREQVRFNGNAPVNVDVNKLSTGQYYLQVITDLWYKIERFQIAR